MYNVFTAITIIKKSEKMKFRLLFLSMLLMASFGVRAQVQVRNEPRHKNVIENKYFRVLDVNIAPHDTTLQHIHSTPSVILMFTTTGSVFYRDFGKDTVIHKVSNWDNLPFHVTDIELLSTYEPSSGRKPLPFNVLFDTERAFAYRLTDSSINNQTVSSRGPMIAGLVAGDDILLHDTKNHKTIHIKAGKETYIAPGTSFYLSTTGKKEINLILFEIK
jgi:hypothetical protein